MFSWHCSRFLLTVRGVVILGIILILGGGLVWSAIATQEESMSKDALITTKLTASGIDIRDFTLLRGESSDIGTVPYHRLQTYLNGVVREQPEIEGIYILGKRDNGEIFYYFSSYRDQEISHVLPGEAYSGLLSDFSAVTLHNGGYGPLYDDHTETVVVGLPLRSERTGGIIAVLGIELDRRVWIDKLVHASLLPVATTVFIFILTLVLLLSLGFVRMQNRELQRSEQALRESEELFRAPVETSLAGVFVHQEGALRYVNSRCASMFGYSPDEVLGTSVNPYIHAGDYDRIQTHMSRLYNGVTPSEMIEFTGIRKDGKLIHLVSLSSMMSFQGRPALYGTILDISSRVRAEADLRESEARFRSLFEQATEGILVASDDGRFIDANQSICDMLGYSREEFLSMSVNDLIEMGDLTSRPTALPSLKIGQQITSQRWLRKRNSALILVEISVRKLADGRIIGFHRDITEKKRFEDELVETRNFLDMILNAIRDPIFVKDHQHRWILLNDALCELVGIQRESLLGKSDYDIFAKEQADIFWHYDEEVLMTGREHENEEEITDASGVVHTISTKKSSYTTITGEKILVGIIRDISERKLMENSIRRSLAEKEVLIHEVHHRVNNNLQIISSLLSMQIRSSPDDNVKRYLRENQSRIYAISLVYELLSHSDAIDQIAYQPFLQKLTRSVSTLYGLDPSQVSIIINAPGILMPIGKAVPLSLIIRELLSNSVLYGFPSGRHGEITISVTYDPSENLFTCRYTDDGVGVADNLDITAGKTMGMSLIHGLTKQLSGEIQGCWTGGVTVLITFPGVQERPGGMR